MLNNEFKEWMKKSIEKYHQDIKGRKDYSKIKKIYDKVINDYLEELKDYKYDIYQIKEYQQVIAFECGHVTYFGIEPEEFPIYYGEDEYYKLCSDYNIIFQDLILNKDFIFQEQMFMKKYEYWSKLFKYQQVYPEYVLHYNYDNNKNVYNRVEHMWDIFNYVDENLPELKLSERYIKHQQENMLIDNNKTFNEGFNYYKEIFEDFKEDYLNDYRYSIIKINDYEMIINVENDCIIYFYMSGYSDGLYDGIKHKAVSKEHEKILSQANYNDEFVEYNYIFQELSFNKLFQFNRTKFTKEHNKKIEYLDFDYVQLKKEYFNDRIAYINKFSKLDKQFPELELQKRYDNWEGIQYYFIVYELTVDNIIGLGVTRTTNSLATAMGKTLIREYENYKKRSYNAFSFNQNWDKGMKILLNEAKDTAWANVKRNSTGRSLLAEKVKYYIVPQMLKDVSLENILQNQNTILSNAENGMYNNYEKYNYDLLEYKWKSEELMYECIKKIFKNKNVIHQYRPFYLYTGKGQLSYDVFVCGEDIAFEYQGQQHFEPVEIFGGEENFKKQQERDKIKKKLSEKNNIRLIYINYWEDISIDLIKNKLEEKEQ